MWRATDARTDEEGRNSKEGWTFITPRTMQSRTARYVVVWGGRGQGGAVGRWAPQVWASRYSLSPSPPSIHPPMPPQVHELLDPEVREKRGRESKGWMHTCLPALVPQYSPTHPPTHLCNKQALKRGEPLTEESIRWLLELHGEMFLIEQHYSTRTRMRRLALNGTPVAVRTSWVGGCTPLPPKPTHPPTPTPYYPQEFSDIEPMVDFQLGTTNIRMSFTVRNKGIVYQLFVNEKRFEDLTQALPSPIASCAEGSGMTFGEPLMFQRLGLLPPHLQPVQPVPPAMDIMSIAPLDSSSASASHHHRPGGSLGQDALASLLDEAGNAAVVTYHHHSRQSSHSHSRRMSSLHEDIFAKLIAGTGGGGAAGGAGGIGLAQVVPGAVEIGGVMSGAFGGGGGGNTTTTAATTVSSMPSWENMMLNGAAHNNSFVVTSANALLPLLSPAQHHHQQHQQQALAIMPDQQYHQKAPPHGGQIGATHGAGALEKDGKYSSEDEKAGRSGNGKPRMRHRGPSDFFCQDSMQQQQAQHQMLAPASHAYPHQQQHQPQLQQPMDDDEPLVLPALKMAKTSPTARRDTTAKMTTHRSLVNLKEAGERDVAAAAAADAVPPTAGGGGGGKGAGFLLSHARHRHLLDEEPPALQRSLSASDVMERPPNLKIVVPAPPVSIRQSFHMLRKQQMGSRAPR